MAEIITHVSRDEWNSFMLFLEKSYGHSFGYFLEHYPEVYHHDDKSLESFYVIKKGGKIVSHVGLYPLDVISDNVHISVGGIGGVATLPEESGKGYMRKLLSHVITRMQEKGLP